MTSAPITVGTDASVDFGNLTIHGDVLYLGDQNALVLMDKDHGGRERLSTNLEAYGHTPKPGHVFIKNWSEHRGVTDSLVESGLVEITEALTVGPFASPAYEVRVIV
ncbi:hypothetical protein WMO79_01050 [Micrococcaceae bacterium Sec7.4]